MCWIINFGSRSGLKFWANFAFYALRSVWVASLPCLILSIFQSIETLVADSLSCAPIGPGEKEYAALHDAHNGSNGGCSMRHGIQPAGATWQIRDDRVCSCRARQLFDLIILNRRFQSTLTHCATTTELSWASSPSNVRLQPAWRTGSSRS